MTRRIVAGEGGVMNYAKLSTPTLIDILIDRDKKIPMENRDAAHDELNRRIPIPSEPEKPASGWQPIDTCPADTRVLVVVEDEVRIAQFSNGYWWSNFPAVSYMRDVDMRAWMPLPEVPR